MPDKFRVVTNFPKAKLDEIVQQNLDDGAAFPYLVTHLPRVLAALDRLIKVGQETHKPLDWMELGTQGNVNRAIEHIQKTAQKIPTIGDHDDHWLNACCRMLMAFELREILKETAADLKVKEIKGDSGN